MKRIVAFIFCVALILAMPITIFAETEAAVESAVATDSFNFSSEEIVAWAKAHFEEISVIVSILIGAIFSKKNLKFFKKSISDTNHNAIVVSENSAAVVSEALKMMQSYRKASEEEKSKLQNALATTTKYLETAKLANIEFANELAELLVLANIPNSKKDELYARHLDAVKSISTAEATLTSAEVNSHDTGETK